MAVGPLLTKLGINQPKRENVGYNYAPQLMGSSTTQTNQPTPGQNLMDAISQRKVQGVETYQKNRGETIDRVANDVASKSAFQVPTDEFGQVSQKLTDFRPLMNQRLQSNRAIGQTALQTEQAKADWKMAKLFQDLEQYQMTGKMTVDQMKVPQTNTKIVYGNGANIPGADPNNPGAKAVDLAIKAFNSKIPYVWGGNSLNKGVDCSALVQQIYKQLGVNIPRVTYDQAKQGKPVPLNQLRPGDLVFFNTGSEDPNGIGTYGHVGLYIGNNQMIDARNSKMGILRGPMIVSGKGPSLAIRPY